MHSLETTQCILNNIPQPAYFYKTSISGYSPCRYVYPYELIKSMIHWLSLTFDLVPFPLLKISMERLFVTLQQNLCYTATKPMSHRYWKYYDMSRKYRLWYNVSVPYPKPNQAQLRTTVVSVGLGLEHGILIHCTVWNVVYIVKFTVYSVKCTVYSGKCTGFFVQGSVYSGKC